MNISFTPKGWTGYTYWQMHNRKMVDKINSLVTDIVRCGNGGLGKPEALKGNMSGWWSRRIDDENRLVYRIVDDNIEIAQCRGHYGD
ncbi:MAG: Txe/YoeB family addiction module toxin [Planctomycetaceae bacterium]|jgi:toxin YoeB|nr:Txe/YoeB family addiction module toxin [Planctomycetaceae bacterium]